MVLACLRPGSRSSMQGDDYLVISGLATILSEYQDPRACLARRASPAGCFRTENTAGFFAFRCGGRKMPLMDISDSVFSHTETELLPTLNELRSREPIFHTTGFGTSREDFERATAPEYWEASASGRSYSRAFILRELDMHPPVDAASVGWQTHDHALRRLGPDTYLFTYTLRQHERITRRATIWQSTLDGWRILYHQGTIVSAEEDDAYPSTWLQSPPWLEEK